MTQCGSISSSSSSSQRRRWKRCSTRPAGRGSVALLSLVHRADPTSYVYRNTGPLISAIVDATTPATAAAATFVPPHPGNITTSQRSCRNRLPASIDTCSAAAAAAAADELIQIPSQTALSTAENCTQLLLLVAVYVPYVAVANSRTAASKIQRVFGQPACLTAH